jgi:hypothetical protein
MKKEERIEKHGKWIERLEDSGIEAREYERMALADSLTGGEEVINTEMTEVQALILAVMESINDPRHPDGSIDEALAYDCPVIRTFNIAFKRNMISNKRKGRMEIVKVMKSDEEEETFTGRIKNAITGAE